MNAAAPRATRRNVEHALLLGVVGLAATAAVPLAVAVLHRSPAKSVQGTPVVSSSGLVQRSGVRIVRVAVSGAGGLVDLRYQVVDSEKAASVHSSTTPPLVIDERSGAVIGRLFMGHIHSQKPKVGLTYYLLFDNPGDVVRSGNRVTVQLGDARLAHVRVR
jgi:hypothetical protein